MARPLPTAPRDERDQPIDYEDNQRAGAGNKRKFESAVVNFYKELPKAQKLENKYFNPNPDAPQHPFRMLICGPSGGGKTNLGVNVVDKCGNFDEIIVYGRDVEQPLYQFLEENCPKGTCKLFHIRVGDEIARSNARAGLGNSGGALGGGNWMNKYRDEQKRLDKERKAYLKGFKHKHKKRKKSALLAANADESDSSDDDDDAKGTLDSIPPVDNIPRDGKQRLIIFDDLIGERRCQKAIADYFTRLRHMNASCINIVHSFFATPKLQRLNATGVYLCKGTSKNDIKRVIGDCNLAVDNDRLWDMYEEAIEEKGVEFPFLNIDLNTADNAKRFRKSFGDFIDPGPEEMRGGRSQKRGRGLPGWAMPDEEEEERFQSKRICRVRPRFRGNKLTWSPPQSDSD